MVGSKLEMKRWAEELAELQESFATGKCILSSETILTEDRDASLERFVPHHSK